MLEWEVTGPASVSIEGLGPQPPSGFSEVEPPRTTTYVLTATDGYNSRSSEVTVQVVDHTTTAAYQKDGFFNRKFEAIALSEEQYNRWMCLLSLTAQP